jgi:hypothetical protein
MADDEKERAERATELRRAIDEIAKGKPRRPRNPNEFVEQEMRERARAERESEDDESSDDD